MIFQQLFLTGETLELHAAFFVFRGLLRGLGLLEFLHDGFSLGLRLSQFTMQVIMEASPRKAITLFLLIAWASHGAAVETPAVTTPTSYEDFAHEHKGCPENSECDETLAKIFLRWKQSVERWSGELSRGQKENEMRQQLAKGGWPVEFYTRKAAQTGFNPALLGSPCAIHNPKDKPLERIWRGRAFIQGLRQGRVLVSRGDTEFEVEPGELLQLQPVYILNEKAPPQKFLLPLDERPVYLEKGRLVVMTETDDLYVLLDIGVDGPWGLRLPPPEGLTQYFEDRQEITCPQDIPPPITPWFNRAHCGKLLNKDTGKTVIAVYYWSCS